MTDDLLLWLEFMLAWLTCPGNNFLSQRCSEMTADFIIGRALAVGLAVMVLVVLWRALTGKKGGEA